MKYLLLLFLLTCIFNTPLLVSAETENNELVQNAKVDAQRDAKKDVHSAYWVAGGCYVGGGGSLSLSMMLFSQSARSVFESRDGYICLGASLIIPLGYYIYATRFTPKAPTNRLLGKPPAYVKSYITTYTHETRKRQTQSAIAGSVMGGVGGLLGGIMISSLVESISW